MEEKVSAIDELNRQFEGQPYRFAVVDATGLKLLDKNARYMTKETYDQLVSNIKHDGALASVPLCHNENGVLTVLSGNHRVQAAREAVLVSIMVMVIDKPLHKGEKIAIQLSHNALEGKDDMGILKSLWEEIEEMNEKLYAGLDSETLQLLDKLEFTSISEAKMDCKAIGLSFLPEEADALQHALDQADVLFSGETNYVASMAHFERVFALVNGIKEQYNIVSNPTAFMKIVELAEKRMAELDIV